MEDKLLIDLDTLITLYCFVSLPCLLVIIFLLAKNRPEEDRIQVPIGRWLISNPVGVIIIPTGVVLLLTFDLTNYSLSEFTKTYISGNVILAAFITGSFAISNYIFDKQQKELKVDIVEEITQKLEKVFDQKFAQQAIIRKEEMERQDKLRKEEMERQDKLRKEEMERQDKLRKEEMERQEKIRREEIERMDKSRSEEAERQEKFFLAERQRQEDFFAQQREGFQDFVSSMGGDVKELMKDKHIREANSEK